MRKGVIHSLPLLLYIAPGGLPQALGRVVQSLAEAKNLRKGEEQHAGVVVYVWVA